MEPARSRWRHQGSLTNVTAPSSVLIPLESAGVRARRALAQRMLVDATRVLARQSPNSTPDLDRVAELLAKFALQVELFPSAHFPSDPERTTTFYRLAEDPDGGFALYVSASLPGRKQLPHDHTTWAVIAGIHGLEKNVVYARHATADPSIDTLTELRAMTVGPGDAIALRPDELHTTEILGEAPALHLHFYGLSQERMVRRIRFDGPRGGHPTPVPVPTQIRHPLIDAHELHALIAGGVPLAVLDIREESAYAQGHLLSASCAPLDRLELDAPRLVPERLTHVIVVDERGEIANGAAAQLTWQGYANVSVLQGGTVAWADADHEVFQGVQVSGKILAEHAQQALATPDVDVSQFKAWQAEHRPILLVDVRPHDEFKRYTIPGSVNCPMVDLALRVPALALDPQVTIVVHCAGRARSLIAAQTLAAMELPNPIYALRNGTMDWERHGGVLVSGQLKSLSFPAISPPGELQERALRWALRAGVNVVDEEDITAPAAIPGTSLYLLDIRPREEYEAGHLPGWRNAPGGQLIHARESFVAAQGARIVLADMDGVRAPYIAAWLAAWKKFKIALWRPSAGARLAVGPEPAELLPMTDGDAPWIDAAQLVQWLHQDEVDLFDLDGSRAFQAWHIPGARFATRRRLDDWIATSSDPARPIVLTSFEGALARRVAGDLRRRTGRDLRALLGGNSHWKHLGLPAASGSDGLLSTDDLWYGPHSLTDPAARRRAFDAYLHWEAGLVNQFERAEEGRIEIAYA